MNRKQFETISTMTRRRGLLVGVLAIVFLRPDIIHAQSSAQKTAQIHSSALPKGTAGGVARADTTQQASQVGKAPSEGIQVHGHWTIDVKNPDGTVVTHKEFENSLTSSGAAIISSLLLGQASAFPGGWVIFLSTTANAGNILWECDYIPAVPVTAGNPPVATSSFLLTCSIPNAAAGKIVNVQTALNYCQGSSFSPASCDNADQIQSTFTNANLTSAQQTKVQAGQTLSVSVEISFAFM
jgi:hypothetical protein